MPGSNSIPPPSGHVFNGDTKSWNDSPIAKVSAPEPGAGHAHSPSVAPVDPEAAGRRRLDRLWATQTRLSVFGSVYNIVDSQLPTFQHTISVAVVGGPKADMRRIWLLCLATAFGRYRQAARVGLQTGQLQATWDISGKSCAVSISYVNSGVVGVHSTLVNGATKLGQEDRAAGNPANPPGLTDAALASPTVGDFLYAGPTQETVGGDTLAWLNADGVVASTVVGAAQGAAGGSVVGGLLNYATGGVTGLLGVTQKTVTVGAVAAGVLAYASAMTAARAKSRPSLPDTNRLITTANKLNPNVQPPAPSGDGLSRTFPWVSLVANALTAPCYQPALPPKSTPVPYTPTMYSPPPQTVSLNGNKVPNYTDNQPVDTDVNVQEVLRTIEGITARKDGYVQPLEGQIPTLSGPVNQGDN